MLVRVGTINVPEKVGPQAWERCFEEIAERAELFGLQESLSDHQRDTYLDLAREHALRQFGLMKGPNPVFSDPKVWRRLYGSVYRLHGRGPRFRAWPGYNEARYATVTVHEHVTAGGPQVTVVDAHLVPRGRKVPAWWRKRARRRSLRILADIVRRHVARGRLVVVLGDFNMDELPDLPGVHWLHGKGVDKIGVAVPDGWGIAAADVETFPAPTDHRRGVVATFRLVRR